MKPWSIYGLVLALMLSGTLMVHHSWSEEPDQAILQEENGADALETPPPSPLPDHPMDSATDPFSFGKLDFSDLQTEEYVVQEGDWLAKILRERGLLEEHNMPELLNILRDLNQSLKDVNLIRPGEKIVILVKVLTSEEEKSFPMMQSPPQQPEEGEYTLHRMEKGESLYRIAMERYGLSEKEFVVEYLDLFAAMNPEIQDPDRLYPGQTIRLPHYPPGPGKAEKPQVARAPFMGDLDSQQEKRVILPGPRIVSEDFRVPFPGMEAPVKTPAVRSSPPTPTPKPAPPGASPQQSLAMAPSETEPPPQPPVQPPSVPVTAPETQKERTMEAPKRFAAHDLGGIMSGLGEEWIHQGDHYIPIRTGGQITLKADAYPLVRHSRGMTVIVDLKSSLPEPMVQMIESGWAGYRVLQLNEKDDLRSAIHKLLVACGYSRIMGPEQPLELNNPIPLRITGDYIVVPEGPSPRDGPSYIVIHLNDSEVPPIPLSIRDYLAFRGVMLLEYPRTREQTEDTVPDEAADISQDLAQMVETVLHFKGQPFSKKVKVKAYWTQEKDVSITIVADYYLKFRGRDAIIDVSGLDDHVASLLKEQGWDILSLNGQEDALQTLERFLEFLHVDFVRGPHTFSARPDHPEKNVRFTLSGIVFHDAKGQAVFATPSLPPAPLAAFLSGKGYRVLVLTSDPVKGSEKV